MTAAENKVLFSERQYFRQAWLWAIFIPIVVLFGVGIYQQLVLGEPFGDHPMSNTGLIVVSSAILVLFLVLYFSHLDTEVRNDGIYFRFSPFHLKMKSIAWERISKAYVRRYNPLQEYGGWGIRGISGGSRALNVDGNIGLQIEYDMGRKLLIGTQKQEEMKNALNSINKFKVIDKNKT